MNVRQNILNNASDQPFFKQCPRFASKTVLQGSESFFSFKKGYMFECKKFLYKILYLLLLLLLTLEKHLKSEKNTEVGF